MRDAWTAGGPVPTGKQPVLTHGEAPRLDAQSWTFRCFGPLGEEVSRAVPRVGQSPRMDRSSSRRPASTESSSERKSTRGGA